MQSLPGRPWALTTDCPQACAWRTKATETGLATRGARQLCQRSKILCNSQTQIFPLPGSVCMSPLDSMSYEASPLQPLSSDAHLSSSHPRTGAWPSLVHPLLGQAGRAAKPAPGSVPGGASFAGPHPCIFRQPGEVSRDNNSLQWLPGSFHAHVSLMPGSTKVAERPPVPWDTLTRVDLDPISQGQRHPLYTREVGCW